MWLQPLPISSLFHWARCGPMGPPQPYRTAVVHSYADWRCCSRPRRGIRRRPCLRRWLRLWCHALVSFRRAYSWAGPTLGHRCDQCAGGYRIFRPPFERLKCLVIKQCLAFGRRRPPSTLPVSPSWDGPIVRKSATRFLIFTLLVLGCVFDVRPLPWLILLLPAALAAVEAAAGMAVLMNKFVEWP